MEERVKIGISNRHVHLTKEVYEMLFDEEMYEEKPLSVPGQYVSNLRVTISTPDGKFENVKVLGPLRSYNQVEISRKDSLTLKINPPVRDSGSLDGAENITISTTKASITLPCCILAQRHLHISPEDAQKRNLRNKEKVSLKINNDRSGVLDVYVKITDNANMEVHLDTDDASAFLLNLDDEGTLIV